MSDIRNAGTSGKARRRRIIKVAPMTRAVRSALAVSALTLAIGFGSGNASAANPAAATSAHALRIERPAIDFAPVFDLTVVQGLVPGGINPQVATLIDQHYVGDVNILNNAPIIESGAGDVIAIRGYSDTGNVSIVNTNLGALSVQAYYGNAIGIYGYALDGNVAITNTGSIVADSAYGLADGIFASGNDVTVVNTGDITATGYSWAAGIEAQAGDVTAVTNTGNIYASASGNFGLGYGIYATGDGSVGVTNDGGITVRGYYASGIHAQSGGDVTVTNYANGTIDAGSTSGSALAWGIDASSNGEGSQVLVDNAADIQAAAVYGATGISAVASGLGGSAQVNNSGDITVTQNASINSYGAYGILVSGDASAVIDNSGDITVSSRGPAFGLAGLSTTGDVVVNSSGDISVTSTRNSTSVSAIGILAAAGYGGSAEVTNAGSVVATGVRVANGVNASATGDVSVANSGSIAAIANAGTGLSGRADGIKAVSGSGDITIDNSGDVYARGRTLALSVYALANGGDITVNNDADGDIEFFSAAGRGWGIWTYAADGDITVNNQGYIGGLSSSTAYGVLAQAPQGNIGVDNSGGIFVRSANGTARGVLAIANTGTAGIVNSGDIIAVSYVGAAYGVFASGAYAEGANSGRIGVQGNTRAIGMVAQGSDGATISNTGGAIYAYANGAATGMLASASSGMADVTNASDVVANSNNATATGMVASAYYDASIDNSGALRVLGRTGASGIRGLSAYGDVTIGNSGPISVYTNSGNAIGLYGYSSAGNTSISNSGDIAAVSLNGLSDAIFASGADVSVNNSGSLGVLGYTWAAGIEAQGASSATVQNDGTVSAIAMGPGGKAYGLYATGGDAVSVGNTGDVEAQGYYATGIEARSYGDLAIDSSGNITAGYANAYGFYSALATGINASSGGVGAVVNVASGGNITATGYFGASGISATSSGTGGTVHVSSNGNIDVLQGNKYGYGAYGVVASGDGDTLVENGGGIGVYSAGAATGVAALSFAGAADVSNAGDIEAISTATGFYGATGILAFGANGTASVQNTGSVSATAAGLLYSEARAVDAQAFGDVSVANAGSLYANGQKYAFGVYASSGNGDLSVSNAGSGDIGFYSYVGRGWGVFGFATQGDVAVNNAGAIAGYAYGQSAGVFAVASAGDASVTNSGSITVVSGSDAAVGVFARADYGTASVTSSGDIEASSAYLAYGVIARGADAVITNRGSVSASAGVAAVAAAASGYYSSTVNNTGTLHAADAGFNVGVLFSDAGGNVLNNSGAGLIYASGADGYAFAVVGGNADETINNSGRILGALSLYGGGDVLHNKAGGTWDIGSTRSTDFGDGDDVIDNQAGATLRLADGALSLGAAGTNGNAFNNAGTIKVIGSDNLIDMGSTVALQPGANPLPLVNTGIIDFFDGATDDGLTIAGSLGGSGAINIDLDLDNLTSDQLYIDGDIASGAVQMVNVSITRMPTTASTEGVAFVHVSGASSAGSFVGGKVVGYSASNFLDIGARTTREAGSGGDAAFLVSLDVLGLNDTGALAVTTATAAATFLNSQVGTFRQRLGVNPYGDADKVMNAFVRFYSSQGDINPTHSAGNFGQGGRFGFAQNSWGREVGINANLPGNIHAGLVLGNADSRQRLSDGVGENRMDGATVGAYATWYAPGGFYVDLSGRWMASDIHSTTAAGTMAGRAHAQATSLEAGYEWMAGGFNVVPQLQYTRTKVDGITPLQGTWVTFQSHGGTFEQGRLGVEVNRTFEFGGLRWTPYGSIHAVHEFDGKTTYTVADNFYGSTGTKGTSTMAELGLGLQKGRFGVGLGMNWTDGGAYKHVIGGQAVARFSW